MRAGMTYVRFYALYEIRIIIEDVVKLRDVIRHSHLGSSCPIDEMILY
jgi:hypothetical protein